MRRVSAFLLFVVLAAGHAALAGTARTLSLAEQKVVAEALAQAIPSVVNGEEAVLGACQVGNASDQGQAPEFQVLCEYAATRTGFKGTVVFDGVEFSGKEISAAKFKLLSRE